MSDNAHDTSFDSHNDTDTESTVTNPEGILRKLIFLS